MLRSAFLWQHTWTGVKNNILRTICFTPESFHARSAHSLESLALPPESDERTGPRAPGPTPSSRRSTPGGQSTHPRAPVTDGHQGSAGVSWGQEGARPGSGRGAGVFGIVVTWPVCLSVCRWMKSMWPRSPLLLLHANQSQGFDCRSRSLDGGIQWSSRTNP